MIFKFALILFLIGFLMIGGERYKSDVELGIERDIYNYTESTINFPLSNISSNKPITQTKGLINEGRLYKIIESGINFLLISSEQISKMGIEYGYQNPDIDFRTIFKYLVYLLIIIMIALLIKPIVYIIIFLVMIGIMIKEKRKRRRIIKE
jgi:hypothetical protein